LRNSRKNTISSNKTGKDEQETVHLFFVIFRLLKKPLIPASEIIIRIEPDIILKESGSEKKITPRNIAKTILAEETSEPAVALMLL